MNFLSLMKTKYPEGSIGPGSGELMGECIVFCQHILRFPSTTGNSIREKINFIKKYGILKENLHGGYLVGDFVVTKEGTKNYFGILTGSGHGAIITHVGDGYFKVAESNFKSKKRISYDRVIWMDDPNIVGVGRFPFRISTGLEYPIKPKISIMFNNFSKPWNLNVLEDTKREIREFSGGNMEPEFYPLRTAFRNWWYEVAVNQWEKSEIKVLAKQYFKETVMPLAAASDNGQPDVVILVINPKEWEGTDLTKPGSLEIGHYYAWDKCPAMIVMACSETDLSPYYHGKKLLQDAIEHELLHYFNTLGNKLQGYRDLTHMYHEQRKLELAYQELDYERIGLQL